MQDLAFEQVGHGRKADVRMRTHVEAFAGRERHRPHLVEEYEWADGALLRRRQRTAHLEALAEVADAWNEERFEHASE